jgi:TRAP-type C4-dicarboxylate transport system permease small subunit
MRKDTFLMVIGSLVFITPLLGIPHSWKEPALFILGALTILTALLYRLETRRRERHAGDVAHAENNPNSVLSDTAQSAF